MTFRTFIKILEAHGFELDWQRGSHRVYKGVVEGERAWSSSPAIATARKSKAGR